MNNDTPFTKVTPGRGKKTNIVTPNRPTRIPNYFQSEITSSNSLSSPFSKDWVDLKMGQTNYIQLEVLMNERQPYQPSNETSSQHSPNVLTPEPDKGMPTLLKPNASTNSELGASDAKLQLQPFQSSPPAHSPTAVEHGRNLNTSKQSIGTTSTTFSKP